MDKNLRDIILKTLNEDAEEAPNQERRTLVPNLMTMLKRKQAMEQGLDADAIDEEPSEEDEAESEKKEQKRAADAEIADAYGETQVTAEAEATGGTVSFSGLYNAAAKAGLSINSLSIPGTKEEAITVANKIIPVLEEFRKSAKFSTQVKKAYNVDITKVKFLDGSELVEAIADSILRCKLYFYFAFGVYQTVNLEPLQNKTGAAPNFLPKAFITHELYGPPTHSNNLKDLHDIYLSLPDDVKRIITNKKDLLTHLLSLELYKEEAPEKKAKKGKKKDVEESFVHSALLYLFEAEKRATLPIASVTGKGTVNKKPRPVRGTVFPINPVKADNNRRDTIEFNAKMDRELDPDSQHMSGGDVEVPEPANFEGDSTAQIDEAKNSLFRRYFNGFLREFAMVTKETLPDIDERIFDYTANPAFVWRDLKARESKAGKIISKREHRDEGSKKSTAVKTSDLDTVEKFRLGRVLSTDELDNPDEREAFSSADLPSSAISGVMYTDHSFFSHHFSDMNYASCVGFLFEKWAEDPALFPVKIFNKTDRKFISINLLRFLYDHPSEYLSTNGGAINTLQIDVCQCAKALIDLTGDPIPITKENFNFIETEVEKIAYKYRISEFFFFSAKNDVKNAVREQLGLTDIPEYEITTATNTRNLELFKEKLLEQVRSLPVTAEFTQAVKDAVITKLDSLTMPLEILQIAKNLFSTASISNMLRGSVDRDMYKNAETAISTETGISAKDAKDASKALAKQLTYFTQLDPENKQDLTSYLFFNGKKIASPALSKFLQDISLEELQALADMVLENPKVKSLKKPEVLHDAIQALLDVKKKQSSNLTEAVDTNNDYKLTEAVIREFTKSLIEPMQQISTELHRFGRFLILFSENPKFFLPEIQSENKIRRVFRDLELPLPRIQEIVKTYEEVKDKISGEFDPLLNPEFKAIYHDMKGWILSHFGKGNEHDQFLTAFDLAENGDFTPLKKLLGEKHPIIKTVLGSSRIGKAIDNLLFGRYRMLTKEEEKENEVFKSAKSKRFAKKSSVTPLPSEPQS